MTNRTLGRLAAALLLLAALPAAAQGLLSAGSPSVVSVRLAADAEKIVAGQAFRLAVVAP